MEEEKEGVDKAKSKETELTQPQTGLPLGWLWAGVTLLFLLFLFHCLWTHRWDERDEVISLQNQVIELQKEKIASFRETLGRWEAEHGIKEGRGKEKGGGGKRIK